MRLLLILAFISCSTHQNIEKRDLDQIYIGNGVEQYFLGELPLWANFSSEGKCRISKPVRYLNFESLYKSYALSYEQLVQFQYSFNNKIRDYQKQKSREAVLLQDEGFLFYNTQEQVLGGAKDFVAPSFDKANIIWIDLALSSEKKLADLRKFMKTSKATSAHPIFVSRCLGRDGMNRFIEKNNWDELGIKMISSSFFSPYNKFMKVGVQFRVDIEKLLKGKKLYFYGPYKPEFIKGKMIVTNI